MSEQQIETMEQITPITNRVNPSPKEVIAYLAEKFPLCFSVEGEAKPLKIGLFQDLADALADDDYVSKTLLRQVLRTYTMSWRYLAACTPNAVRVGLQGEEAGIVEESQAEHAAQTLAQAKEAYAQRRAEQRKAQRKAFFKEKAREENSKKRAERSQAPKASAESLSALANKFSKDK